jgi:hypothetical protein
MQIVPVAISILAALVSILSAWISFRNVRQTQRTRLGQLVDEMSKGNWEFDRELEEKGAQVAESVVAGFNVRQEILARQALAIFPSFRGKVSSREITVVAGTLEHIDDYSGANELYMKALKIAQGEGSAYLSMVHQDYGNFLFAREILVMALVTLSWPPMYFQPLKVIGPSRGNFISLACEQSSMPDMNTNWMLHRNLSAPLKTY